MTQTTTYKRLKKQDEQLARCLLKSLLTLIQGNGGDLVDDLVGYALAHENWWIISSGKSHVTFHFSFPSSQIGDMIHPVRRKFMWMKGTSSYSSLYFSVYWSPYYQTKRVRIEVSLHQSLKYSYCYSGNIMEEDLLYEPGRRLVKEGSKIPAKRKDRSFWFPGVDKV